MGNAYRGLFRAALVLTLLLVAGVLVVTLVGRGSSVAEARELAPAPQPAAVHEQEAGTTLPRAITVIGEGKVRIKPDTAQINIGVEVVGDTVQDASSQGSATMDAVLAALKAQGVEEKDVQTSGYSIWVERPYGPEGTAPGEPIYHVSNNATVIIRDLDTIGTVLDSAIEAGANNVYGITFSVADPAPLMSEARAKAVADAQARAKELAELNDVTLGEVISVSEVIGTGVYPGLRSMAAAEGLGGGAGPIAPGELEMTAQLQISYAIQ